MTHNIDKIENQTKAQEQKKERLFDNKTDDYVYVDKPNVIVGFVDLVKSLFK